MADSRTIKIVMIVTVFTVMIVIYIADVNYQFSQEVEEVKEFVVQSNKEREEVYEKVMSERNAFQSLPSQEPFMDPVQKRLEESKENWNRSMEKRKAMEDSKIFKVTDAYNWKAGVFFWDFFYPAFDCPHSVERIGHSGDGGKWICGLNHLIQNCNKSPIVIYSFGVNGEVSFEEEILARTNFSVYMFDHTIDIVKKYKRLQDQYPGRVFLEKIGIAADKDTDKLKTLVTLMKKYGHEFIDILKVDVEWAEWKVIEAFKTLFPSGSLPVGQLSMEFHLPIKKTENLQPSIDTFKILEEMHMRPFRVEFNVGGIIRDQVPRYCEYTFININVDNCLLHS